jgi:PAS domain S-box-containing protein
LTQETLVLDPSLSQEPEPTPSDLLAVRFQLSATTLTWMVMAIALAGIAGWVFERPVLTSVFSDFVRMTFNTAIALFATGAAMWLYRLPPDSHSAQTGVSITTGAAITIAVVTAIEYAFGFDLGLDRLLLGRAAADAHAGGMPLVTVACLLFVNGAILLASRTPRYGLAQGLVAGAILLTTLSTVGYFFGTANANSSSASAFTTMAVPMAAGILLSCLAFLFSRPREGVMDAVIDAGSGGLVIRQLLPVVFLLPLLLAWLTWQGVKAGLYQETFAYVLFVTLTINALSYAIWAGGRLLRGLEDKRLAAEADRQRSEERLRRAVSDAPVPIVIHHGDQILHMSQGWSDVSGYTRSDTPTMSEWMSHAHPDRRDEAKTYLARLATLEDTSAIGEQSITTKNGDERVWVLSTTPLGGGQGDDRAFLTMATDVTEVKRAEAELRQANESLEHRIAERTSELTRVNDALKRQSDQLREQATLLDLVRDGILVRDLYGTIVYWSAGAREMYGFDRHQALGHVSHTLLKAEYPQPLVEIEAQVMRDGFWEGHVVHTTHGGQRLFIESRWTLTRTERGAPEGFLEVNRDITQRKHAQDSLADSEMRFRAVSETAIEGIISMDETGVITYWNPGAARLFGRVPKDVVGMPMSLVMAEPFLTPHHARLDEPAVGRTFETIGRRADGTEFPIEISLSAWSNTQGHKLFTAIVRDITERKDAELALEAKAEELSRSNQELEQFAYVASHDLQEPLRMVSNYTQLLGRRYKDKLDGDANEFIDFAVDGAKRMQELIHDLLAYARVGTRGKEFKPIESREIVTDAVANLSGAIEDSHAEIILDDLPAVTCDASQLVQVFQNLMGNAIKFSRPGSPPVVRVSAIHDAGAWEFTVADNGIGIEPKYFDRIFQMFQRLHTRQEYPGTGIGLSLCRKIVERHGGRIRVESTPGQGTRFSFTIPDHAAPRREDR